MRYEGLCGYGEAKERCFKSQIINLFWVMKKDTFIWHDANVNLTHKDVCSVLKQTVFLGENKLVSF